MGLGDLRRLGEQPTEIIRRPKPDGHLRIPIDTIRTNLAKLEKSEHDEHFRAFAGLLKKTVFDRPKYTHVNPELFLEEAQHVLRQLKVGKKTLEKSGQAPRIIANSAAYDLVHDDWEKMEDLEKSVHQLAYHAVGPDHPHATEFAWEVNEQLRRQTPVLHKVPSTEEQLFGKKTKPKV